MLPTLDLRWLPHFTIDRQNNAGTLDLSECRFRAEALNWGAGRHEYRCWLGLIFVGIRFSVHPRRLKARHLLALGAALLLWAASPAFQPDTPEPSGRPSVFARIDAEPLARVEVASWSQGPPPGFTEAVLASYSHPGLAGLPMANGEPYDPERMIAASLDLPRGSWALVCRGDLSAVVEVCDFGPFPEPGDPRRGSRAIDLSEAAARLLGMVDASVATVTIHPLPIPPGARATKTP